MSITNPEPEFIPAIEGRVVTGIPTPQRRGAWTDICAWHKANPKITKMYPAVSETTPTYIKRTYGVMAYGRNTRVNSKTGRKVVDMYLVYYPEREAAIIRPPRKRRKRQYPSPTLAAVPPPLNMNSGPLPPAPVVTNAHQNTNH